MAVLEMPPLMLDESVRARSSPSQRAKHKPKPSRRVALAPPSSADEEFFSQFGDNGGKLIEEEIETEWGVLRVPINLPDEDDTPLETNWHRIQIGLLVDVVRQRRSDKNYYTAGNMFIYFSSRQWRGEHFRGPDFFFVDNVDGSYDRRKWEIWKENWRYPDLIIELLSESTADTDRVLKKKIYAETFGTKNYFHYDPDARELVGYLLVDGAYQPLQPNEDGKLWCSVLNVWVGFWEGEYLGYHHRWVRFFDENGEMLPTTAEAAQSEARAAQSEARAAQSEARAAEQRADDAERQLKIERARARAAEEALLRLQARLAGLGHDPNQLGEQADAPDTQQE